MIEENTKEWKPWWNHYKKIADTFEEKCIRTSINVMMGDWTHAFHFTDSMKKNFFLSHKDGESGKEDSSNRILKVGKQDQCKWLRRPEKDEYKIGSWKNE